MHEVMVVPRRVSTWFAFCFTEPSMLLVLRMEQWIRSNCASSRTPARSGVALNCLHRLQIRYTEVRPASSRESCCQLFRWTAALSRRGRRSAITSMATHVGSKTIVDRHAARVPDGAGNGNFGNIMHHFVGLLSQLERFCFQGVCTLQTGRPQPMCSFSVAYATCDSFSVGWKSSSV